jgi:DNA invertase Pin-like site-specific DNA recombinase
VGVSLPGPGPGRGQSTEERVTSDELPRTPIVRNSRTCIGTGAYVELEAAWCDRLFEESISSRKEDRPHLRAALDYCREGDALVVGLP